MNVGNFRRVFAFLVDLAVVDVIITRPLSKLVGDEISDVSNLSDVSLELIIVSLLIGIIGVFYWTILEYKVGQTLGAWIFKLRAKSLNKGMNFTQALLRNATKISVALLIVDSINIFFSEKKQRYFEVFSKTVTLRSEER